MKKIPVNNGKFYSMIDDEDYKLASKYKWYLNQGYASRTEYKKGISSSMKLHRLIMDCPKGLEVDHINHDKLDNRKTNLRIVTHVQQNLNRINRGKSGYKGVFYDKWNLWNKRKWAAYFCPKLNNKKKIFLGYFMTKEEAAIAYNKAAAKIYGEFALLNIIQP
jgi:hypothetical protein